ncbi:uncharacterized protein MELLADRAFT_124023 [Melampsora larici-populina 98AG31]|uniref:Secreted protein n=1 Tax=Melampsora larici-populina (strain 98AG31 / pathotype 3-4-7) TaxID=747676 RepID=F4S3T4_MELLP|nr:uncharacterized protein MELLADRAFT_124023 [Melampsora larici-populina 98AG31]EGG00729.1 hypothetical protein MELLADRAFT_124023 [Melampsora larici-populina 98AG31]
MTGFSSFLISCFFLIKVSLSAGPLPHPSSPFPETNSTDQLKIIPFKVPVTLIVMSQCPEAKKCQKAIDEALIKLGDKMDVEVGYVAKLNSSSRFGVTCFHGDTECEGNIQQLCYKARFPFFKDWWSFIQCQTSNPLGSKHIGTKSLLEKCIKKTHPEKDYKFEDDQVFKGCLDGPLGRHLLYHSVLQNKASASLNTSCEILINHQPVCKSQFSHLNSTNTTAHQPYNTTNLMNVIESEYKLANLI